MYRAIQKTLVLALLVAVAGPVVAEELSEGAKAQLILSDELISLGRDRKDALLVITGVHLRNTITNDTIAPLAEVPSKEVLLEEAKALAGDRDDLVDLAEDVKAAESRGCYNLSGGTGSYSCGYTYDSGSYR